MQQGFYGLGDSKPGAQQLARQIEDLVVDAARRTKLGMFGRQVVTERYSLQRAIDLQLDIYRQVLANPSKRSLKVDAARSARLALMLEYANHDPARKRNKRARESALLAAARSGRWPPVAAENWV